MSRELADLLPLFKVIDRDDWTTEGVLQVTFAQPPHSEPFVNHGANCSAPGPPNTVLATRDGIGQDNGKFFRSLLSRRDCFEVGHRKRIRIKDNAKHEHPVDNRRRREAEQSREMKDAKFVADCARFRAVLSLKTPIRGLMVKNHFDDVGWPVSTVWDTRRNERRPELSFTMYVADDTPSIAPQAIYASLNQDMPKDSSWTLDIVWLVANMSTAMQHYSQEARRWPSRRVEARHRLAVFRERVFRCAVGHILPEEILQHIIDLSSLRRPTKEDFDSRYATRRHVFMYLDASTLGSGPQIAVADPRVSSTKVIEREIQQKRWCRAPWVSLEYPPYIDKALEVSHWRSWTAVAKGLHTLWTIQGSRRTDIEEADLPYFTLKVQMPATCSPVAHDLLHPPIHSDFQSLLTLHNSAQAVTVKWPVFPESILFDYLTVTDSETGQELDLTRLSKVERSDPPSPRKLDLQAGWLDRAVRHTFYPGQLTALDFGSVLDEWWYNLVAQNELVDGRSYIVGIREGLEIQRWTYGTESKPKGPFNLPAVGVRNGDEVSSFVYRRPS